LKHLIQEIGLPSDVTVELFYQLPPSLITWSLQLVKTQLKKYYDASVDFPWNEEDKLKELSSQDSRSLVLFTKKDHLPIGFLSFQFILEDTLDPVVKVSVLYLFELCIQQKHQGKGLGSCLIHMSEQIGRQLNMCKIMLTVFKSNLKAFSLYQKRGFELDEISPELKDDSCSYLILSKTCRS
jgi:ribosomal protein S18 acetylase RimI-like enzyme